MEGEGEADSAAEAEETGRAEGPVAAVDAAAAVAATREAWEVVATQTTSCWPEEALTLMWKSVGNLLRSSTKDLQPTWAILGGVCLFVCLLAVVVSGRGFIIGKRW